ncbi:MAG TPA: zinc ribbon domain-containing protein [Candidatus Dormibacteraeota bacterium]
MKAKRPCPGCGRVLSGEARFCVGCGAELPPVADEPEPDDEPEPEPELEPIPVPAATVPAAAVSPPPPPPPDPVPQPSPPPPGAGLVASAGEVATQHFDRYAGTGGELPPAADPPPPAAPTGPARPDISLVGAFRRLARRSPVSAGVVSGLGGVAGVALFGLAVGGLVRAAHGSQGCSTGALSGSLQGGCLQAGSTNGVLTDWNAMLWSVQGVGVSFTAGEGGLVVRLPLGLGMLLSAVVLAVAGAVSVRLVPPRRMRDVVLRAAVIAVTYTAGMLVLALFIAARGDRLTVGADNGLLLLWGLLLGFTGSIAGMFRRLFGSAVPRGPLALAAGRLGGWAGILEAGMVGTAAALALGALLGVVAAATHLGEAGTVLRTAVLDVTTRPLPSSPTGTVAAVGYLVLALPTLAAWVLAYSLIIPTVTVGTPLSTTDYGLLAGDHDAWLWAVVALPIAVTLLTGYVAARRRGSASVEMALLDGALGGLALAVIGFLVVVLLDGGGTLSLSGLGGIPGGVAGGNFLFGPGMQYTLGALLLWGVVGGAAGGYLSLLLLARGIRPPLLRRYETAPPPSVPLQAACPGCGVPAAPGARFCSACGATMQPSEAG